jgi:mycofactocin precursor
VLLDRPEGDKQDPPRRGTINLNPIQVSEICHRVLNYRARPAGSTTTEENGMGIAPEQLEETAVETEPTEDATQASEEQLVVEDLLVEDVSIDGMCGVY